MFFSSCINDDTTDNLNNPGDDDPTIIIDDFCNFNVETCAVLSDIFVPEGLEIESLGAINFNGNIQSFHFLNESIGFALLGNNVGGYAVLFKTKNSDQT